MQSNKQTIELKFRNSAREKESKRKKVLNFSSKNYIKNENFKRYT